jgi:hypothetical protein
MRVSRLMLVPGSWGLVRRKRTGATHERLGIDILISEEKETDGRILNDRKRSRRRLKDEAFEKSERRGDEGKAIEELWMRLGNESNPDRTREWPDQEWWLCDQGEI